MLRASSNLALNVSRMGYAPPPWATQCSAILTVKNLLLTPSLNLIFWFKTCTPRPISKICPKFSYKALFQFWKSTIKSPWSLLFSTLLSWHAHSKMPQHYSLTWLLWKKTLSNTRSVYLGYSSRGSKIEADGNIFFALRMSVDLCFCPFRVLSTKLSHSDFLLPGLLILFCMKKFSGEYSSTS